MLEWFLDPDQDCLSAEHPYYHDSGSSLYYELYDLEGRWIVYFEGSELFTSPNLIDCLEFCEKYCEEQNDA